MKHRIFLFIAALLPLIAVSQKSDRHLISLKNKKDQPLAYFDFYIDKVYDRRQAKDNIGTVQRSIANVRRLADFERPFTEELSEYFNVILPKSDGKRKISLCFYELFVTEQTDYKNNEETGMAVAVVDFIEEKDGKLFTVGRFSEVAKGTGMDVTAKHPDRIKEVLKRCFNDYNNLDPEKKMNLAFDAVETGKTQSFAMPPKGVYISFFEALGQKPSSVAFYSNEKDGRSMLFREPERTPLSGYYGFSDGESFYLNLGKYSGDTFFYKADAVGPKWLVEIPNRDKDLLVALSPMFGYSGAFWVGLIPDEIPVLVDRITGKPEPANDGAIEKMLSADHQELWKQYSSAPKTRESRKEVLRRYFEPTAK